MDISQIPSPCYVLDEQLLRRNLALMQRVKSESGVHIICAFKGYAMWSSFPLVRQYLDGATASSLYEARLCFEEMKSLAHTYAAVYFPDEFEAVMSYSSHISFNSLSQFHRYYPSVLAWNGQGKHKISCGIRINPEFSVVETDLYNPGKAGSRLGEDLNNFKGVLPEGVEGIHVHALCESSAEDTEGLINRVEELIGAWLPQLKWVNLGGGHLMTRPNYDVEHLIKVLKRFKTQYPHLDVVLEPGSAVGWDTGVLVSTVLDIVNNHGVKTLMMDVSFTAHMPDTLEMPYRPRIVGAKDPSVGDPFVYRIGGTSCLSGDFMAEYSFEKEVNIGDTIVFEDMIHYTMVKTTMFNGVPHPSIGIWRENEMFEIVRQFGYEDYKRRLS
ncbi:MAG: carboxynorspermidine decarboxylase [Saprospiraceae bacterium]|nr:carboxynorspermidine decarboxylase [Saprospiraceae bacterium]